MSLQDALTQVLTGLEMAQGAVVLGADAVERWGGGDVDALTQAGLLKPAGPAKSVICPGCEHRCIAEVNSLGARAFVVCEMPDMQEQMGRVAISSDRLRQWQATPRMLAGFLMLKLELAGEVPSQARSMSMPLGMLPGPRGRRWARLVLAPLSLEINRQRAPLIELIFVNEDQIELDRLRVSEMLSREPERKGELYTPNVEAREARKLATAAMRQDWRDAHAVLTRQHPGRDKRWCARRIARMTIAQGRDAETIRKQLF